MTVIKTDAMKVPLKMWDGAGIAENAIQQMRNVASLPFVYRHAALMADAHLGIGGCVGAVVATKKAIVPALVGVDLGCGMMAVQTSLKAEDLPDTLAPLRAEIERAIPVGGPGVHGSWAENGRYGTPNEVAAVWRDMVPAYDAIVEKHPAIRGNFTSTQLGTLGSGNHFIEICLDTTGGVWTMLHSGSRGVGNRIGTYFINKAKEEMVRWHVNLIDKDLAYLSEGSQYFDDYIDAVSWAQVFAYRNRILMMNRVLESLRSFTKPFKSIGQAVDCHHNYVSHENHYNENVWITRKGAVNASEGTMGIIPGSMGEKSFIVRGKGNPESFNSCSHGAGRIMSRTGAKKLITAEDHAKAVAGVECRLDTSVIDESPSAYKNIDDVISAQKDLIEIVTTLKQVLCVKG